MCGAVHQCELFRTVCPLVHCCTELRVPAIYVLPIDSGLSVWWSVEYAYAGGPTMEHGHSRRPASSSVYIAPKLRRARINRYADDDF